MISALDLTQKLIRLASVTPEDNGCQALIGSLLSDMGFTIHPFNRNDTQNIWAVLGNEGPLFCFAGHTDVVPPGDPALWHTPCFEPSIQSGYLYGRGAADMKSGLAAMITATAAFLKTCPHPKGRIAFLITSDEEGMALDGTQYVVDCLKAQNEQIDWCVVTEPSSLNTVGDTIRIGRRGTLTAYLTIVGKQGHVAYPHLAKNPIHLALPFLQDLLAMQWDKGHPNFPSTSLQIANIQAGTGANNVIPGALTMDFNFRYNPLSTHTQLIEKVESLLQKHGIEYQVRWHHGGNPFLTDPSNRLVEITQQAIETVTGRRAELSTGGGTSDARFIADICSEIIEVGVCNHSIHQANEHVALSDIEQLERILIQILQRTFG